MLQLVRLSPEYRAQLNEMMDEWTAAGEKIIPWSICKHDYHDFDAYLAGIDITEPRDGKVPDTTLFCLDTETNRFVGAVNIRHYLNDFLMRYGGHIGDGIRPSMRGRGLSTKMIALALDECRSRGIERVLMICDAANPASARTIQKNGGILENRILQGEEEIERYWIDLTGSGRRIVSFTNFYGSMNDDAVTALAKASAYLRAHPNGDFLLPAETYRITTTLAREAMAHVLSGDWGENPQKVMFRPHYRYDSGFSLAGQQGTAVYAAHTVFMVDGFMEPVTIADCENVTLCDLTIDHLRKPYAFGVVESLTDPVDGWCDCVIRLDDACPITEKSPIRLRYGFFDPATGANRYAAAEPPIYIDPHHIGIRVRRDAVQPGDAFCTVHTFHARPAILIERAKNVHLAGVTIHSQPGMGIVGNRSENVVLEELSVVPSVGQFWSSNTDATHFTAMKGLLRFYHCHFSHHGDDATNVHGYYQAVVGKCGGNTVLTQEKTPDGTHAQTLDYPDIGDTVEVSRIDSMEVVDTLTVVDCTPMPDEWMCRVTFDHALPENTDGLILSDITRLPRVEFVGCDVAHHFARSVLLKNRDSLVEDCTFYRAQGPAVVAAAEAYWYEGVCPANLTVRGCRITDCGAWGEAAGIVVKADCDHPAGQTIRNVTITDNEITAAAAHGIFVRNTDGVTIHSNRICVEDTPVVIEDCIHVNAE